MFAAETYARTRLPLHQATPLPGWCYVAPQWYEREVAELFRKDWLCVGRAEQVPNPGDFFYIELVGQPLVVVRDEAKQVRVHSAVCRHRGAVIAEGQQGKCRAFVCPYHSWTYSLSGKLMSTPGSPPPMAGAEGFRTADHGLTPVRSEIWAGFVFVTFDEAAPPVLEWLGHLPAFLADYDLGNMQWTHKDVYEVPCNWKVWLENAFENYHAMTIHRKHMPDKPQNWQFERTRGPWEAMYSKRSIVAYAGLPPIPGLDERKAAGLFHVWIQPSVQLILTSSYMKFRQYLPEGPEKLRLYENWAFPRSTVEHPDFGDIVGAEYYEKYSQIVREDLAINPVVQKGMRSGAYRPGRYSLEEYIVHRIANRVLDRVIGPDNEASRRMREDALTQAAA